MGWCAGGGHLAGEWLLHVIENSPGFATSAGVPVKDVFVVNRESRLLQRPRLAAAADSTSAADG